MRCTTPTMLALLALLTLSVGGCSRPPQTDETPEQPAPQKQDSSEPGSSIAAPTPAPAESPTTVKFKEDGEPVAELAIPDDIPTYTGATPAGGSNRAKLFVYEWKTTDAKSDIMDFYRAQLPESGWTIESEKSFGAFKASKEETELDVWIGQDGDKPVSILIRLTR